MKLTNIFEYDDERAVSPVIGVILMVAITVILAAVIGAFVIGIGGEQDNAPTASINFDQGTDTLTVQHQSGATLDADEVTFSGDVGVDATDFSDTEINDLSDISGLWAGDDDEITAGESIQFAWDEDDDAGNEDEQPWPVLEDGEGTINVVWESSDTDSSSILADFDYDVDGYDYS